jgi:serine/threonine-protein kinase
MGSVYAARNTLSGAERALKVVRADLLESEDARARFLREVALASRVRHPNVVEAHDPLVIGGEIVLPMELLEGETLGARLARGPLGLAEAVELVATLAGAVATFHAAGIIHRDLKPANVFLARTPSGAIVPKILDLGAAREIDGPKHTQTGHTIGSPAYMAPEQARGERGLDGRVDVYALGVLLYVALTCRRPVESDEHGSAISKLVQGVEILPPSAHRPEIPPALEQVVLRAMAWRREERFESASALGAALAEVHAGLTQPAAREVPRTRPAMPRASHAPPTTASLAPAPIPVASAASPAPRRWALLAIAALALLGLVAVGSAAFAVVWTRATAAEDVDDDPPSVASTPTPVAAAPQPAAATSTAPATPTGTAPTLPPAGSVPAATTPADDAVQLVDPWAPPPDDAPAIERAGGSRTRRGPARSRSPEPEAGSGLWLDEP